MLDSNKCTNFNKKSHFKAFFFCIVWFYDTHIVSYDLWVLSIYWYDTELFTCNTIRIVYHTILTTMNGGSNTDDNGWW